MSPAGAPVNNNEVSRLLRSIFPNGVITTYDTRVNFKEMREDFITKSGGNKEEYLKDLVYLFTFFHNHGTKINKRIWYLPSFMKKQLQPLIKKYDIQDSSRNNKVITLGRLYGAFPLENLIVAMNVKPRSFIEGVDFTRPHHWLSIFGAASFIPKDRKYDSIMKIVVYYQNQILYSMKENGVKNLGALSPDEFCFTARRGDFPPENVRIAGLIKAGIIDPISKEIVEEVQNFANLFMVQSTIIFCDF